LIGGSFFKKPTKRFTAAKKYPFFDQGQERTYIPRPFLKLSHITSGKAGGLKDVNRSKRFIYSPPKGGSSWNN